MEDIFKKYKKYKIVHNTAIIAASLFLAIGVNIQLTGGDIGKYIKSNIIETSLEQQKSDLYLEMQNDTLHIKTSSPIQNLSQIQFSLLYNNKSIKADNLIYDIDNYIINYNYLGNGIINIQLSSDGNNSISAGETIISMKVLKNTDMQELINLLNANFTDSSGKTYLMSTSGIQL